MRLFICAFLLIIALGFPLAPLVKSATPTSDIEQYLINAQFQQGQEALVAKLQQNKNDDNMRFALGVVQLMGTAEKLMQSLYRYGLQQNVITQLFPILRLPVPENPQPQPVTYNDTRNILQELLDNLTQVKDTLEPIKDHKVKLTLRIGLTRMDFNANGKLEENESFWKTFSLLTGIQATEKAAQNFVIAFDAGDVVWLKGYCNLLCAIAQVVLAYDESKLFDSTAHLIFAKPQTPHAFLANGTGAFAWDNIDISDIVAFIHLINFPTVKPERLTLALENLQSVTALSRESWKLILAETDNDREWLPNPRQKAVIPNATVTQPMIDGWLSFLDEADTLLTGKKLVPFWRKREVRNINLNRVFTKPSDFDLVLWVQGTAAAPYLEFGKQTKAETWRQLLQVFRGQFFQFAAWFN
ncbi:hypothetical protein I8748_26395 [Nostoc sp. CENA67]|uniref:Uncharacterized protein n=1 Tax=Amazonocrinis nigriterrae CENA67 TaxID=2794033 RepID=A0A8J7HTK1_9NOST|nr:hypothetical protein [Amazonocrinis nigriterrae]MBH8565661.1 hypothetical protein [Amazonocrinis nigriterrae CENA67]